MTFGLSGSQICEEHCSNKSSQRADDPAPYQPASWHQVPVKGLQGAVTPTSVRCHECLCVCVNVLLWSKYIALMFHTTRPPAAPSGSGGTHRSRSAGPKSCSEEWAEGPCRAPSCWWWCFHLEIEHKTDDSSSCHFRPRGFSNARLCVAVTANFHRFSGRRTFWTCHAVLIFFFWYVCRKVHLKRSTKINIFLLWSCKVKTRVKNSLQTKVMVVWDVSS